MVEPADRSTTAGQRLSAPESYGVSTLEPGLRPPAQAPGKMVAIRVQMLDDTQEVFQISQRSSGKVLFDLICVHLNLVEGDYFGLEYQDNRKMTVWLDLLKPALKQIRRPKNTILRFVVKFFPPDHTQLLEELTQYLFALQIKQDLACGRLICNDTSAALMVSHIIQSEIGDFEETQSWQHLLHNKYLPDQDAIRDKIIDCHRKHVRQTPAESDFQLLEIARRLEMYGVRLHPAKDREGTKLSLAVAHTGVLVFQGYTKINAFNWSKIRKLSFKRRRFLIKLREDPTQNTHHDTLEFSMASRNCCKVFWKICVEYHAFFRLFEEPKPKPKPILFTRGSSFRFSGRTQKQIIDYVKDSEVKKLPFERKHSKILSSCGMSPHTSSKVPTDSAGCVQASDQLDSARLAAQTDGFLETATSNGFHDPQASELRLGAPVSDQQLLNPGPSSRANKGSNLSIPYIDCSDIDSECEKGGRSGRANGHANDSNDKEVYKKVAHNEGQPVSLFGSVNGFYHTNHQESKPQQGLMGNQNVDPSMTRRSYNATDEMLFNTSSYNNRLPLHSTILDEIFQGKRGVPTGRPLGNGTRSQCSSPVIGGFHQRTNSLSQARAGNGQPYLHCDDGRQYFNIHPSPLPAESPGTPRISRATNRSYSPIMSGRTPQHLAKQYNNIRNRSDTDPFILSQLTSTPLHHNGNRSVLHAKTPSSAPTERRVIITNGNQAGHLLVPGQPRSNTVQRLFGQHPKAGNRHSLNNNLAQSVQMIDGSTSSGTDTSDTESDTGSSAYSHPLMYGNPAAVSSFNSVSSNGANLSPVAHKFSFGNLDLEDGQDGELEREEGCYRFFNEEDMSGCAISS